MRVLKVTAEGFVTSFRYPHFMLQIHPSFHMPPPATVYGHICSALGEWFDPAGVQFAYHFTFEGHTQDVEHTPMLSRSGGYLPGTSVPKVMEGKVSPFERELLFMPRFTLYINRPEWEPFFHSPRYTVVLGRSQDLFTYTDVRVVELQQSNLAYIEHTLLPYQTGLRMARGITVLMPRYLDYHQRRQPEFEQYVVIKERIDPDALSGVLDGPYWIDPTTPQTNGAHLGLFLLTFTGEDHEHSIVA